MKKALAIIGLCLVVGYLIFALIYFKDKPKDGVCTDFEITLKEDHPEKFIDVSEIEEYISRKGANPKGKSFDQINTDEIEATILKNGMVKKAEVYIAGNSTVKAVIHERKPILRVITNTGESYYVDDEGKKMPTSRRSSPYLPVATGDIKEKFACTDLYIFAQFLHKDKFWNAQIEQIVVRANEDIVLIPRVGNQEIILGKIAGYQKKLDKLMDFYQKGLNKTGWNKYSVINLKYEKQVVCSKR